ncbi:hypothetical protein SteCoe_11935 [Stentor coeruleus]|uniref:Uncharacterized protein n=1 Tax=Stentor coeruleus TaxID=5963 RepID=A0A1R2CC27_9CILI|nr:hypothetical protein SteCoe_11935 [Stentor coeruleus]
MERIKCSDNLCEETGTECCVCQKDIKLCIMHLEQHKKLCEAENKSLIEEQKATREEEKKVQNKKKLVIDLEEISQIHDPEALFSYFCRLGYDIFKIIDIEVFKITNDKKYIFLCITY